MPCEPQSEGGSPFTPAWAPTTPGGIQSHSKHQSPVSAVPSGKTLFLLTLLYPESLNKTKLILGFILIFHLYFPATANTLSAMASLC